MDFPTQPLIDKIIDLRKNARFLEAWQSLQSHTPPETWSDGWWKVNAARIISQLGGSKRSRRLTHHAWHREPGSHSPAREEMLWNVYSHRGALTAWEWRQRYPAGGQLSARQRSNDLGFGAFFLGKMRDFCRAKTLLNDAVRLEPANAWLTVVAGYLEEWQDRHGAALDFYQQAISQNPAGVAGIHALAETFIALGRDHEAVSTLSEASERLEAASLAAALHSLQMELGDFAGAEQSLSRYEKLSPLAEDAERSWVAAHRCDLACHQERYDAAAAFAAQTQGSGFYERVAARLSEARDGLQRKVLGVGFVRQHHLTCAPATFTTLARYWRRTVDHLDLAEAICYDGTPYHSERCWAEANGWVVREFTITPQAAKDLIDRELPFTLSTVQPGNAHCQAVIGYDEFRGVLLIRDPYYRSKGEFLIEEGLKDQAPFGPRGMVLVPREEAERLHGLELPESALYDAYHELQLTLEKHDRPRAEIAAERLKSLAPGHRLMWQGQQALACYDGQPAAALAALEGLQALFPEEVNIQLRRLNRLSDLECTDERRQQLELACAAPKSHPLLWQELASTLATDARRHPEARRWLWKCRRHRLDAWAVHTEATLLWDEQHFEKATELYRFASCLDGKNEHLALNYFRAARWVKRQEEALGLLRLRWESEKTRSSQPARSLFQAYEMLDRMEEAFAVLHEQQRCRPDDADFLLWHAQQQAGWNRIDEARALLASAEGRQLRASSRNRLLATLAHRQREGGDALDLWRQVLKDEPLAIDAHRAVARLIEEREGSATALAHLRDTASRFPHNLPLRTAVVHWAREENAGCWIQAVREYLGSDPDSAWAHRELALALQSARQYAAALQAADEAISLDPAHSAGPCVRGGVLLAMGRGEEGRAALRQAMRLAIDAEATMRPLIEAAQTPEERQEDFKFIQDELICQTTSGDAVTAFYQLATPYLNNDDLLAFLRKAHDTRPDLWQTGSALAKHLARMKCWDEAVSLSEKLTKRFPLLPRVWLELGLIHRARPNHEAAIAAMEHARQLNPAWPNAMQELAATYRGVTRYPEARSVMEQAVRHAPLDALNHGWLAEFLYHDGEKAKALERVREAIRLSPGYTWAWSALQSWGAALGQPSAARDLAREIAEQRPGEPRSWLMLADTLEDRSEFDERLAALDRALELNSSLTSALDEKARLLTLAGRFDQALALCTASSDTPPPPMLQARHAWILSRKDDLPGAIQVMNQALQRDAANAWGWQMLAEWHQSREEWDAAEEAVRQLTRLNPHDATPLGYLADLKLQRGDRPAAITHFQEAVDLDANYTYAGLTLFRLWLEDKNHDKARATLDQIRPHLPPLMAQAREVIYHIHRVDREAALRELATLLHCEEDAPAQMNYVTATMRERVPRWAPDFSKVALAALRQPSCNVHTGAFYAETRIVSGSLASSQALRLLPPKTELAERALEQFLNEIGQRSHAALHSRQLFGLAAPKFHLRRLEKRYGKWLHESNKLWGIMGYSLYSMRRYKAAYRWLREWDQRAGIEPWMLNNYALVLQHRGDAVEFERVTRHVLSLPQHNDSVQRFRLWAALKDALDNRQEAATAHLENTSPSLYDSFDRTLRGIVDLALNCQNPNGPVPAFDDGTKSLLKQFLHANDNKLMRRAFGQVCTLQARRRGSLTPRLWGWVRRYPVLALITIAGLFLLYWMGMAILGFQ